MCHFRRTAGLEIARERHNWMRNTSRPVSRVLFGELPLRDGHSSGTSVTRRLKQSTRVAGLKMGSTSRVATHIRPPLFDLAPGGVCPAADVAARAVRSYRTVSPLPCAEAQGGLFSVALSLGSPPAAVSRHRSFKEPGLSSTGYRRAAHLAVSLRHIVRQRPSGRLVGEIRDVAEQTSRLNNAAKRRRSLLCVLSNFFRRDFAFSDQRIDATR
jgi:hypothetical protein